MTVANFIIAGTEKAGTTSVFSYLAGHPQVAASRRKETDFFRRVSGDVADYASQFPDAAGRPVVMEASPGYLGEAEVVVPRMRALIPGARLLFILRDPVERFQSSYHFHRGRLDLPQDLSLGEYLDACLAHAQGHGCPPGVGIDAWFLKVLEFGCYALHLRRYYQAFPREQVKVAFYDELCADPRGFMEDLSGFLGIDATFWRSAAFQRVNATFSGRSRSLHRLAVLANDRLEPLLRPRPRLKVAVVGLYKRLNRAREGYDGMADRERARLEAFYGPHNGDLQTLLGRPLPSAWYTSIPRSPQPWDAECPRTVPQ
jgi:hypothetical protein